MSELHDDTCANCGHASESHHAGIGRCYRCPAVARCMRFVTRESAAAQAGHVHDNLRRALGGGTKGGN